MTVWRRFRYDLPRNYARRAVVDEHLLAEPARESRRDQLRGNISCAARFGGNDADGFGRISLRRRNAGQECDAQRSDEEKQAQIDHPSHGSRTNSIQFGPSAAGYSASFVRAPVSGSILNETRLFVRSPAASRYRPNGSMLNPRGSFATGN